MTDTSKRRRGEQMGGAFVADPRPQVRGDRVLGARCSACGYATAPAAPWCPACQSREQAEVEFGPGATIWSSTLVHIPVGKWQPPYALAYIDLDDGPRVLAHLEQPGILPAGTRVRVQADESEDGDLIVAAASPQEARA